MNLKHPLSCSTGSDVKSKLNYVSLNSLRNEHAHYILGSSECLGKAKALERLLGWI